MPSRSPFGPRTLPNFMAMTTLPQITPDGRRLYFNSDRPVPGQSEEGPLSMNVWYVEREDGRWGEPQAPGAPLNPNKAMYVSVTLGGAIYTTDISGGPGQAAPKDCSFRFGRPRGLGPSRAPSTWACKREHRLSLQTESTSSSPRVNGEKAISTGLMAKSSRR